MNNNIITVRSLILGDGVPKICIPATARNMSEIENQVAEILTAACDLVEWRADYFEEIQDEDWPEKVLAVLRKELGERPILFTFRTKEEGGERSITMEEYEKLNEKAAASSLADLVDIELNRGEERLRQLTERFHTLGCRVIASYHDFGKTSGCDEIVSILRKMQSLGADITKAALMPQSEQDVLEVLQASVQMKTMYADRPFITMSMGRLGAVSRLCGALNGSAVTFATAGKASAPGQMEAELVARILPVMQI